jgi:hypothetical protein
MRLPAESSNAAVTEALTTTYSPLQLPSPTLVESKRTECRPQPQILVLARHRLVTAAGFIAR